MIARWLLSALVGLSLLFGLTRPGIAADGKVTVFARIYASPGRQDEAKAYLLKVRDYVMKNDPPAVYDFYQSAKDPTQFFTFEIYNSQAQFDEHMKTVLGAAMKAAGAPPEGAFAKPVEVNQVTGVGP